VQASHAAHTRYDIPEQVHCSSVEPRQTSSGSQSHGLDPALLLNREQSSFFGAILWQKSAQNGLGGWFVLSGHNIRVEARKRSIP